MQMSFRWGNIDLRKADPYTLAASSLVILSVLWICASKGRANTPKDRYPLVFDAQGFFPLSLIYKPLNWFKNGPKIIHDAYEKVHI